MHQVGTVVYKVQISQIALLLYLAGGWSLLYQMMKKTAIFPDARVPAESALRLGHHGSCCTLLEAVGMPVPTL